MLLIGNFKVHLIAEYCLCLFEGNLVFLQIRCCFDRMPLEIQPLNLISVLGFPVGNPWPHNFLIYLPGAHSLSNSVTRGS